MKPKLTRSFAPRTRPVAGAWRALIISSSRSSALAEIKEPPADNAAAPAVARAMNSRRVDFFAMRIVLPIVYFRRSIAAQEKFAQKVKECLMARTLDLIRGYMFSRRMEPRGVVVVSQLTTASGCRGAKAQEISFGFSLHPNGRCIIIALSLTKSTASKT